MAFRNSGYILVITLIMLSILSMLVSAGMMHVVCYRKALAYQQQQHRHFYQLEHVAYKLLMTQAKECTISGGDANKVIERLKSGQGCILNSGFLTYHYFIEELADYPCMMVKKNSSHHRRITLMQRSKTSSESVLQLRYVSAIPAQICKGSKTWIASGVISWRYITDP